MDVGRLAGLVLDPGLPPVLLYGVLFLGCVLESFFPPWPSDLVTLYSAFLAGRGILRPDLVLAVAVAGSQSGVMGAFWLGRRWGRALLAGPVGRYLPGEHLAWLETWFDRYGAPAIALSRFVPAVRALVTPAAGLAGFAAWKVWLFAGVSVVLWNAFVVGIGLAAGQHLDWARQVLARYNATVFTLVGLGVLGLGLAALVRRRWPVRP